MKKTLILIFVSLIGFSGLQMVLAQNLNGKKVLFVDSYHQGYAWSDGITQGIKAVFKGTGINLKIERMDTKRNKSAAFKKKAALKAKAVINSFKPDVVIAADDNASKFLIVPYYKNSKIPFVFCGVNWDASVYGFPFKNVTGMVEVTPVPQLLKQLEKLSKGKRIGTLAPDLLTAKKDVKNYRNAFGLSPVVYYAKDYNDYKKGFLEMQKKVDILILLSDGGLYDDKIDDLNAFVLKNSKIPIGTSHDFVAPRALIAFAKVAEEQGEWSAQAAIKILRGASPSSIPIVNNKKGTLIINAKLAMKMGVDIPYELAELADKILE